MCHFPRAPSCSSYSSERVATREAQSACRAVNQRRRELGGAKRVDKSYSFIWYKDERDAMEKAGDDVR